jgi:RNA polymerase sigma-70 factor (ECF subfamily)
VSETNQLAAALGRHDERALGELYDRYGRTVYAVAFRMTGDSSMAEEITLDSFLQVWQQIDRYDSRLSSIQGWLFTIARSRAIDRLRARGAAKRTRGDDPSETHGDDTPERVAELAERQRIVRAAMAQLPAPQRAALELAYYEGLSHSQIAERLAQPLGTVKTRIRQAMGTLRRCLAPLLTETP